MNCPVLSHGREEIVQFLKYNPIGDIGMYGKNGISFAFLKKIKKTIRSKDLESPEFYTGQAATMG